MNGPQDHHDPHDPHDPHDRTRGHTVADQLAKDARAKEARMLPETGPLADEQLRWALGVFTGYLEEHGLEPRDVARQIGDPISRVTAFCKGEFHNQAGDSRLARRLIRWVRTQEDADREGAAATYVSTGLAEKMIAVVKATASVRMMGVIVGCSGVSKSTVCRAIEAGVIPGSVHVELTFPHGRPAALARLLAKRTGCPRRTGSLAEILEALIDHLKDTGRLLMIDEAHYLKAEGCQVLRDLHKQTGCPIVLVGTRDVLDTINDFNEFTGQFKRLFAYTLNITEEIAESGDPLYSTPEIARFAKSMGLRLTGDGLGLATELACLPGWGGLGSLRALLLNARAIALDDGAINRETVSIALRQMEGATGFARVQTRRAQSERRRVAVA